ncbi:MAG: MmgE/PrpD family protein [Candidatus Eisenbacteria bacterium]|nr:MmgE/PrpD family protein [Candidatus Eisenbacteria bacterium]
MTFAAESFARFAADLRFEALPEEVKERAKDLFLDTIGIALFGAAAPWSKASRTVITQPGPCAVFGTSLSTSADLAALVNGVAAHAYDYDDVHNESITHPAAALVPAILAVGQAKRAGGKIVLLALVAGYEVVARVGTALVPLRHRLRGFHPTGTCGPFGASLATGFILGLDTERLVCALGIAGSCASGLMEYWADGTMTKRVHAGLAAHHGVLAAFMAAAGFTGPASIFEGRSGLLRAYTDDPTPEKLTEGLGKGYEILNSQIKLYACRSALHTTLEALFQLRKAYAIDVEEIIEITVGHVRRERVSDHPEQPRTILEAQMSLPFTVAVALYEGAAGPSQYSEKKLSDPRILALASRVKPVLSEELLQFVKKDPKSLPSTVEILMRSGKKFFHSVDYPPDGPGNRSGREALIRKFNEMAGEVLGLEKAERVIHSVLCLERLDDVSPLCELLIPEASHAIL